MTASAPSSREASVDAALAASRQLFEARRFQEAEAGYREVLMQDPNHAKARFLLGSLLYQTGRPDAAIVELERAIQLKPDFPAALINLGGFYLGVGRAADAANVSRRAIALLPDSHEATFNLGHALLDMRDWAGAIKAYENYIRLNPSDGRGYGALGDALKENGQFDAAMVAFETAMTLTPDHHGAYLGVVDAMLRRGWNQAAIVIMESLAAHAERDSDIQRRVAETRLMMGYLSHGWEKYDENRLQSVGVNPPPEPPPYWKGEDLGGKRLLIWSEQGLGDEVLYAGLIPDALARGARCTIVCSPRMVPVFRRSFPEASVTDPGGASGYLRDDFDFQVAAGSLGRYLRRDFSSFPRHTGYLKADTAQLMRLRGKYEGLARGRRIVGLAWKSKQRVLGSSKSADLLQLGPILQNTGAMFVSLQYGDCTSEIALAREKFGAEIYEDREIDQLADADGLFAQVGAMDLVVGTSNSAIHAAGSMNVPAWLLLPRGRGALWYWFVGRTDSPWYPSVEIFRSVKTDHNALWETAPAAEAGARLACWLKLPAAGA